MSSKKSLLILSSLFLAAGGAGAQGFGRVANTPYDAGVMVISPPSVMKLNLMNEFQSAWRTHRQAMSSAALSYLNQRDVGGGFRATRNQLHIAENGRLYVGTDSRGFTVRFALPDNTLSTYLHSSSPLNGEDQQFTVTFDLDISIDVDVRGNQLVGSPARIQSTVGRPMGKATTTALAVATGNLGRLLSGPDFIAALLSQVNAGAFSPPVELSATLARMNPMLQRASAGGNVTAGYDSGSGSITLTLRRVGF
jgi:hypothetical protein